MNGYILESRKILDSPIWSKPPLYFKVWHFLLIKAQFQEYDGLKRGQVRTSIPEIQEAMSYKVGYRKIVPSYDEVRDVIKFLKGETNPKTNPKTKTTMITTTKTTRGFIATICNYNKYQDFKFYESHNESHDDNHNGNHNEPTNDKEYRKNTDRTNKNNKTFVPPTLQEVQDYITEKGYHFDAEAFVAFYESNGWKVGKNKMKSWKSACVTWEKRNDNRRFKRSSEAEEGSVSGVQGSAETLDSGWENIFGTQD